MTTATRADGWANTGLDEFVSTSHMAGAVAYEVASHSLAYRRTLARLDELPEDFFGPDVDDPSQEVFELLNDIGRLGYLVGRLNLGPDVQDHARLTTTDIARAVAALAHFHLEVER